MIVAGGGEASRRWLLLLTVVGLSSSEPCDRRLGMDADGHALSCACSADACLRKCCPRGETIFPKAVSCSPSDVDADPSRSVAFYGDPCRYGKFNLDPGEYEDDTFFLLADGTLYVPGHDNATYNLSQFCVEPGANESLQVYLCFKEPAEAAEEAVGAIYVVYPVGMMISLPFLVTTLAVYAIVSELRNLHGRTLMCHVTSLIGAYVCLSVVQLFSYDMDLYLCISLAFVVYFSFLASFFWLNVMCFDIWWTFSGYRPLRGSEKEREHKKFVFYSIYAWGSPMLLLLVCLLMNLLPNMPEHVVAPQIGKERCWFSTRQAEAAYFYGPMALIVVCNIILFVLTALRIVKLKKETAMLKGEESRRHDVEENKQRFVLYLKLFVVMGVNWGMEVISFMVRGPQYLWYVTDIGNTLQGVLIFLIFVWKDKIRRLLARRLCPRLARADTRRGSSRKNGRLSKSVASPTSSFSLTTTKATTNGSSETARMTREESEEV